ncbi:alpha/beta hydrolase family protein [Kitasatospora sp. NPDC018058]
MWPEAENAADASPLQLVGPDAAPVLLIHGAEDTLVPVDNSERLAAA